MTEIKKTSKKTPFTYGCRNCKALIVRGEDIICSHFRGFEGKATLFESVSSVTLGQPEEWQMTTGKNTARRFYCDQCNQYLGWTYVGVPTPDQEYKLGKHLLEMELLAVLPQ